MKKSIRIICLALCVLMTCGILFGCGGTDTDPTGNGGNTAGQKFTLTIWGAQEDQAMLKEMCNAYAAANPQNEYKFLFGIQGENDTADKVLNDVTSGPDIYSFPSDQLGRLYTGGALSLVGGTFGETVKANNSAASVDAATLTIGGQDKLYAYPVTADNTYFVYYDKSVFTNPEDLGSLDKMLDVAEAAGKKVHFKLNDDGWYLSSFFFSNPDLKYEVTYDDNMQETGVAINYNDPAGLDIMKSIREYVNRDGMVVQTDDSKIIAAMTENGGKREAAAVITGIWNAKALQDLLGDDLGYCKLPTATIAGEQVQLSGYMGYKLIGVNGYIADEAKLVEAHKLASWLTNEQNQIKRYETRGFRPTNTKADAMDAVVNDPVLAAIREQSEFTRNQKGVPGGYWTPMGSLITPLVTAKTNGEEITDAQLQEYLDALCEQIRK